MRARASFVGARARAYGSKKIVRAPYSFVGARARSYGSKKIVRLCEIRHSRNLLTISLSVGESLPKFQQISKFATMALFDKIKHQICPEFMDNDAVTKAY